MQKHPEITRQRIKAFTTEKGIGGIIYPDRMPVKLSVSSYSDRIPYSRAIQGEFGSAQVGDCFGPAWSTHWFKLEGQIPLEWTGKEVHLLWDSSSEACIWENGQPRQGLTGSGPNLAENQAIRPAYCLTHTALGGEAVCLFIEMACNTLFGHEPSNQYTLKQAEIAVFNRQAWDLLWDLTIIADMAAELPPDNPRAGQALYTANQMVNLCQLDDPLTWDAARRLASGFLNEKNGDGQHNLSAIGHAHLDTAWLWPVAETHRKAVRTFTNALRLMEEYPEYKFTHSQAQHYAWIKEEQPTLYAEIRRRVNEGRWLPAGGTWVEPDCNLPSGESLVRQFLYGQRFFKSEFGEICREFWNPDVFGYSAALPQILRGVGIRFFLTQKLSWNQFNKPDHQTFLWEGLDGSQVLTHFPPCDTYNSLANVKEVLANQKNFKEHDRSRESYLLFGFGDGGGGPTREMLEQLRRMQDVDGLPRVDIRSPQDFFARCEHDLKDPVTWVGELYLEYHRGTYTTQARNKCNNRCSEFLMRDIEILSVLAGTGYPTVEIERLWKLILLNQFHDILPGSSITQVYQDSAKDYTRIHSEGKELQAQALRDLCGEDGDGSSLVAVNTLGWPREEIIELPISVSEEIGAFQTIPGDDGKCLAIASVPAMGWAAVQSGQRTIHPACITETETGFILKNNYIQVELDRSGRLVRLYDRRVDREVLAPGAVGNRFILFDDDPLNFEAWDVDIFHLEKFKIAPEAVSAQVIENGPLRVAVEFFIHLTNASSLRQRIFLTCISPRLDFSTWVDWHEIKRFLKVEFPFNLRSEMAAYEIQFGHVHRPTHYNTRYDLARFEVCAHHWADLSEPGYGVALLNDSKYGYSTYRNMMRLSLLRGSFPAPDPTSDQGEHHFNYALLPHPGSFQEAGVIAEGYRLNVPMQITRSLQTQAGPFFQTTHPAVVIDTIKKAEDSDDLIVRLYESFGGRWAFRLESSLAIQSAVSCSLLEEEEQPYTWSNHGVDLQIAPFQILTLKLKR